MAGEADRMAICIMPLTLAVQTEKRKKEKRKEMRRTLMEKSVGGGECLCHGAAGR